MFYSGHPMASSGDQWDLSVDVVAVGSGIGGLSAAIAAHDAGGQVVVLEKAEKLGGVSAYSGGEVFLPNNHLQASAGVDDSPEKGRAYFEFLAAGYADAELQANLLAVGPVAARYFQEKAGVRWKLIADFPDYYYPTAPGTLKAGRYLEPELFDGKLLGQWQELSYLSPHMPNGITHDEMFAWGGFTNILEWDLGLLGKRMSRDVRSFGPAMMGYFIKAALIDRGIPAYLETPLRALIVRDGEVIGVRAERAGKAFTIRAKKGVVLAVGGYDYRPELTKYFEQVPEWHSMCQPTLEGDALVVGGEIGAALATVPPNNLGHFFGYNVPGETQAGAPLWRASWEGGFPHAIWVNRAGLRFGDESFYRDYLPKARSWSGVTQSLPNFPPFLVFDQNFRDKYGLGAFLPSMEFPDGLVARASSLRGLAEQLGIDPDGLESTVARFNGFVEEGVDRDFGRGSYPWAVMMTGDRRMKNPNLGALVKPPFYGLRLHVTSVGVNAAGLKTNQQAQVMHVRGAPIAGLYAAGNCAAPLEIGAGYQSGLANLRGMVAGYLAGRHASARPLGESR
jgi:3-oxosteroid 1-dehydrogenase